MEKKTINVHAFTVHLYAVAVFVLIVVIGVLGLKYWHLKTSVKNYTASTIWMNQQQKPNGQVSDYALIIAQGVNNVDAANLQTYVSAVSKDLNRDVVVMDKNLKILADTVPSNKGTTYVYGQNEEVKATIGDGQTRTFEEKSTDYPNGITEIVVPIKTPAGNIIGAVLVSQTQVYSK